MNLLHPDTRIHNPTGVRIESAVDLDTSCDAAWAVVGDFGGFHRFITGLESTHVIGNGIGCVRHKTFKDGNFAVEQLNSYDPTAWAMTWTLIHTTLPVGNLWAAMQVMPLGLNRCKAVWTIQAEPIQAGLAQAVGSEELEAFKAFLQSFADGAMGAVGTELN